MGVHDFFRGSSEAPPLLPEEPVTNTGYATPSYGSTTTNNNNSAGKPPQFDTSSTCSTFDYGESFSDTSSPPHSPGRPHKTINNNNQSTTTSNGTLSILQLATIIFYSVSGGPFGVEESIRAAGPFYTLVGFLVAPLIFSLPECLMTVELSTGFQSSAAGCAWVEEAFGTTAGFLAGFLQWVSGATDNAIYPVLFLQYALQQFPSLSTIVGSDDDDSTSCGRLVLITTISVGLSYMNYMGLDLVGNMTIVVCIITMSPFVLLIIFGAAKVDPSRWFKVPSDFYGDDATAMALASQGDDDAVDAEGGFLPNIVVGGVVLRSLVNNIYWNFNSFDNAGSFSEEIGAEPGKVLPKAMMLGLVMVVLGYFLPLLVALGTTDAAPHEWVDGYLATVVTEVVGPWLGQWMVFAAALSSIGQFQAELSSDAYMLMGMADRGYLPKILATRSKNGSPIYSLLLGTTVIVLMGSLTSLDSLIEMLNFTYAFALLLEYAAFIKLRISKPDVHRPFKVPLSTRGCCIALIPTLGALMLVIALASYTTILFNFTTIALGIIAFTLTRRCQAMYPSTSGTGTSNCEAVPLVPQGFDV